MLDLDFAFFNMRTSTRQGLANRKQILDRLAPYLFSPRVQRLIKFGRMGLQGCNVMLPLGEENWSVLNDDNRVLMLERTEAILDEYQLARMGVDRRLKDLLQKEAHRLPIIYGDQFISVLAAVLIDGAISRHGVRKIVLIGKIPHLWPLLNYVGRHRLPISLQNYNPGRYEILTYRLLYEEGLAVSNSFINPQGWQKGDLILSVLPQMGPMALAAPGARYIQLDDGQTGLAPELEQVLQESGLEPKMHTLAPILETCLLKQAGKLAPDAELTYFNPNSDVDVDSSHDFEIESGATESQAAVTESSGSVNPDTNLDAVSGVNEPKRSLFQTMIEAGDELGLWNPFLDKGT